MQPIELALELLDYSIGLIVKVVGVDNARQTIVDRIEITLARVTADQVAAARFGQEPPAG